MGNSHSMCARFSVGPVEFITPVSVYLTTREVEYDIHRRLLRRGTAPVFHGLIHGGDVVFPADVGDGWFVTAPYTYSLNHSMTLKELTWQVPEEYLSWDGVS